MTLAHKLSEERRARLAAERLLEMKEAELNSANRKLGRHARALSDRIERTEAEVVDVRNENRRVKTDLTAAHQKIEIAERRLWHSIRTIKDGFAFFNSNNEMVGANDAYLRLFDGLDEMKPGVTYSEILLILTEEGIVDTEDLSAAQWRASMLERWNAPNPKPKIIRFWNGLYARLIDERGPDGDVVSLAHDITDTVRYENSLKEARFQAEAASRTKSAFLANMSHEIRTPMNGIVGMAELLSETGLGEEQKLFVDTIRNSGEALLTIINDVLDYSKIEAEKLQLRPMDFDFEQCIHEVMRLLQPTASDKGVDLLIDYDLFLPTQLNGDPGRIRQVLTNVIGNAVKFTASGHVLISVTGTCEGNFCELHVTIQDTGIGIPEDKVDHIFDEFNQVDDEKNREFEGTGLGLAITKRLIELMEGQIWVTSKEGNGTCVGFMISLRTTGQGELELAEPSVSSALIVDSNDLTRGILQKQISLLGISSRCATRETEALEEVQHACDLAVVDALQSGLDGLDLAKRMRAIRPDLPIFLLTSNRAASDMKTARETVTCVLPKPVSRQVLFRELMALAPKGKAHPHDGVATPLPVSLEPAQNAPNVQPDTARKLRVLAAEDNKTNQLVLSKMLKNLDIDLTFANDGAEAVALFESTQPDIVFMDISMPKKDGKEATRDIRALERVTGNHTPIIAMTAHAMSGDQQSILAAGVDHYLTKPLKKALVIEHITKLERNGVQDVQRD